MADWMHEAARRLQQWCAERELPRHRLERIFDGIDISSGRRAGAPHNGQEPTFFLPGLPTRPWWDPRQFDWVPQLEGAAPRVRAEFERSGGVDHETQGETTRASGSWATRYLVCIGRRDEAAGTDFPETLLALDPVPGADHCGMTFFSSVGARTHIHPHAGFTNAHLRGHLALRTNDACRMRVGSEARRWQADRVVVFDDTYEHEVWNDSDGDRVVLLFDFYHPDLDAIEREAVDLVMNTFRHRSMRDRWGKVLANLAGASA